MTQPIAHKSAADHTPVMLPEVLQQLAPEDGKLYLDGTFGAGGYTRGILESAECTVIALDRDPSARERAEPLATDFTVRFHFVEGCFGDAENVLHNHPALVSRHNQLDGMVFDLGVSSMQFDQAERGFSFQHDGPLDMRMGGDGPTARDIVNSYEEQALADLIYRYGEERQSRRIARNICLARQEEPIETTRQLREIIHKAVRGGGKIDPATRSFQALRIAVNDELGELERVLDSSIGLLAAGGRLVVVSFHSLEDRIVKQFLDKHSGKRKGISRHMPDIPEEAGPVYFQLLHRGAVKVTEEEARHNPRARSARLRAAIRTEETSHG